MLKKTILATAVVVMATGYAVAEEFYIDEGKEINTMRIDAVFLKPIEMEPKGMALPASQADVHLEADIHAVEGNPNGFGAGEWVPYLSVNYKLKNLDNGKEASGTFMPMIADDGPHYGDNIKLLGYGNYKLTFTIEPPTKNGMHRHTDKETGVAAFWKPFSVEYNWKWAGFAKAKAIAEDEEE